MRLSETLDLMAGSKSKDFAPVSELRDRITMKVDQDTGEIDLAQVKAGGPGSGRHKGSGKVPFKPFSQLSPEQKGKIRTDPKQKSLFGPGHTKELMKYYNPKHGLSHSEDPIYQPWGGRFQKKVAAGGPGSGRKKTEEHEPSSERIIKQFRQMSEDHNVSPRQLEVLKRQYKQATMSERGYEAAGQEEMVERENGPVSRNLGKFILKVGTQFCVKGTGNDPNLGCYPSREQAEAVMHGKSFTGLEALADGEPTAGATAHAHIEPRQWFHPPSLRNPQRVPTDDPGETNNRFLDVMKRKEANKDRMKILKRSAPGGLPPQIPVRTTLIAPHTATYQPGMFGTSRPSRIPLKARRRRLGR